MSFRPSSSKVTSELQSRGWNVGIAAAKSELSRWTVARMMRGESVSELSALKLSLALEKAKPRLLHLLEDAS